MRAKPTRKFDELTTAPLFSVLDARSPRKYLCPMAVAREQVTIETREQWRAWLAANHESSPGIWLVTYKKSSGRPHLLYDDLVEEALCFGWIDSQARKLDEERSQLLMTPRRLGSRWSRSNKERIAKLTHKGMLASAGLAVIERAKQDGTWSALDDVENLIEPSDLAAALDAEAAARRHWEAFPRSARRGILEWILSAKRPETRARRIEQTATLAAENVRANQWSPTISRGNDRR